MCETKVCNKCGIEKPISEYYFNNQKKRINPQCKSCVNTRNQSWKNRKHEHHNAYCRKWNNDNKERKYENDRKWIENNPEKYEERMKKWREKNHENLKKWSHDSYAKDKPKRTAQIKKWQKENPEKVKSFMAEWRKNKRKDPQWRIQMYIRGLVKSSICRGKSDKLGRTEELLGATIEETRKWLESKFLPGMSWDNHGLGIDKWNIDHIIPVSIFDMSKLDEQKACNHYTNLQPLWCLDNIKKSNKIEVFTSEGVFLLSP